MWEYNLIPSISLIIANIVITYISGIVALFLLLVRYICIVGNISFAYYFYVNVHRSQFFLAVIAFIEFMSSLIQSVTIINRLSINILSESIFVSIILSSISISILGIPLTSLTHLLSISQSTLFLILSALSLVV